MRQMWQTWFSIFTKIEWLFIFFIMVGLVLIVIAPVDYDSKNDIYKYEVIDSRGWGDNFTNDRPLNGCVKISTGEICGSFKLILNKNYKGE